MRGIWFMYVLCMAALILPGNATKLSRNNLALLNYLVLYTFLPAPLPLSVLVPELWHPTKSLHLSEPCFTLFLTEVFYLLPLPLWGLSLISIIIIHGPHFICCSASAVTGPGRNQWFIFHLNQAKWWLLLRWCQALWLTLIYPGISVNALDITLVLLLIVVNKICRLGNR